MVLAAGAAAGLMPRTGLAATTVLRGEPVMSEILPELLTPLLGFNGTTPGPEIRVRQGEALDVRFENQTGEPSAIHWHGVRLENAMDGVPGLTQDAVAHGDSFEYSFVAPDAGTFWYHSHHRSWEQVAKGLYGPLIVDETRPPVVDHDITVMIDDWRVEQDGSLAGGFGNMHDFSHAGRLGNQGEALASRSEVRMGDRVRLRMINAATARTFPMEIAGIEGRIVALDGMPLRYPEEIADIVLASAQRVDVIAYVTGDVMFNFPTADGHLELGRIKAVGENAFPLGGEVGPLPQPVLARPSDVPDRKLSLNMQGGAMGGRHAGEDIWSFNGVSGMPQKPWATFRSGETVRIALVNETAFAHNIHLHGHHFFEISASGSLGALRDTTLVNAGETRDIVCVFDNPGNWLLHCHTLGHQVSGMKTWVEVKPSPVRLSDLVGLAECERYVPERCITLPRAPVGKALIQIGCMFSRLIFHRGGREPNFTTTAPSPGGSRISSLVAAAAASTKPPSLPVPVSAARLRLRRHSGPNSLVAHGSGGN